MESDLIPVPSTGISLFKTLLKLMDLSCAICYFSQRWVTRTTAVYDDLCSSSIHFIKVPWKSSICISTRQKKTLDWNYQANVYNDINRPELWMQIDWKWMNYFYLISKSYYTPHLSLKQCRASSDTSQYVALSMLSVILLLKRSHYFPKLCILLP